VLKLCFSKNIFQPLKTAPHAAFDAFSVMPKAFPLDIVPEKGFLRQVI
jgi:hypothetical protein